MELDLSSRIKHGTNIIISLLFHLMMPVNNNYNLLLSPTPISAELEFNTVSGIWMLKISIVWYFEHYSILNLGQKLS